MDISDSSVDLVPSGDLARIYIHETVYVYRNTLILIGWEEKVAKGLDFRV